MNVFDEDSDDLLQIPCELEPVVFNEEIEKHEGPSEETKEPVWQMNTE